MRTVFSCMLLLSTLITLSACDTHRGPSVAAPQMRAHTPDLLAHVDNDSLSVIANVNDDATDYPGLLQKDGTWAVRLTVELDTTHQVSVRWFGEVEEVDLLLVEQSGQFYADSASAATPPDLESVSSGSAIFDADCDQTSNLEEINAGADPLSEPGCTTDTPNDDPQPGVPTTNPLADDLIPATIAISAGCFMMGQPPDEPYSGDDRRYHDVCVDAYHIGVMEVSFDQYTYFSDQPGTPQGTPSDFDWGLGRQPVLMVTQQDAVAYTQWLSDETGLNYRLPTEAEWEYAARAGTTTPFWTGQGLRGDQENVNSESAYGGGVPIGFTYGRPLEIGSLDANPWGLHDMLGNLSEWTCSAYDEDYTGGESICTYSESALIAIRGGNYSYGAEHGRAHVRQSGASDYRDPLMGFRVVRQ